MAELEQRRHLAPDEIARFACEFLKETFAAHRAVIGPPGKADAREQPGSVIRAPMNWGEGRFELVVASDVGGRYGDEDAEVLRGLARALGAALETADLREELARTVRALEIERQTGRESLAEREREQRQVGQAQKMESLGAMAGAIAHDFNNRLTTILGFAGLVKRSAELSAQDKQHLEYIEDSARRAATLTWQLLTFARGGMVAFERIDLCDVVRRTLATAAPALEPPLRLETSLPTGPVELEGDAQQLEQALLSVVLNARDAITGAGEVRVTLAVVNGSAEVCVADTGSGMDEETRLRVFEPFYTTKAAGVGTGLGLAITYGIVQAHGGWVRVDSTVGEGTSVTIGLPLR
ncbi:MAG TPA: ATP-binding protein [Tepidiformaceae bacterium]|nr:ATP-binding protein [Tepidiformaceae bacterium]